MIWLYTNEPKYYQNHDEAITYIKKLHPTININQIINHPTIKDIQDASKQINTALLSPLLPSNFNYPDRGYFNVIELPNYNNSFLTSEQQELEISQDLIIKEELGLEVITTNLKEEDFAGALELKQEISKLINMQKIGEKITGILLVGPPGTGKTFSAEYLSVRLNRILIDFNIAKLMSSQNRFYMLEKIQNYFKKINQKAILWIDELEKAKGQDEQFFGRLLTFLNELNTNSDFDVIILATANNIEKLIGNPEKNIDGNPELIRDGRFMLKIYKGFPSPENAEIVMKLYQNKWKKSLENYNFPTILSTYLNNNNLLPITPQDEIYNYVKTLIPKIQKSKNLNQKQLINKLQFDISYCSARDAFIEDYYFNYNIKTFIFTASNHYSSTKDNSKFIYVEAELKELNNKLHREYSYRKKTNQSISEEDIFKTVLEASIPLKKSLGKQIQTIEAQKEMFVQC